MTTGAIPRTFVWHKLHSLMGLWLVLFLIEHLLTNSQAALLLGENGRGFVLMVNAIHNLPYLEAIELILLGVPLLIHMFWGVRYLLTAKVNSYRSNGSKPSLPQYGRNRAYTWMRITSVVLLIGIVLHVIKFRFLEYPWSVHRGTENCYFIRVSLDNGLYTVAGRLGVSLYDQEAIEEEKRGLAARDSEKMVVAAAAAMRGDAKSGPYNGQKALILNTAQNYEEQSRWVGALERKAIGNAEVIAVAKDFGTASLLAVRDTFKSPLYAGLYTIFVLAACFHAFNGLWTFLTTWGLVLRAATQRSTVKYAVIIMGLISFLGLAAVWGTYWVNLRT